MGLKRWGGLTSKLDGLPIASDPHLWWQACPSLSENLFIALTIRRFRIEHFLFLLKFFRIRKPYYNIKSSLSTFPKSFHNIINLKFFISIWLVYDKSPKIVANTLFIVNCISLEVCFAPTIYWVSITDNKQTAT